MKTHTPLVVGNWKMNPSTSLKAQALAVEVTKAVRTCTSTVDVVVCPPALFIEGIAKKVKRNSYRVGAQDVSPHKEGAYTGFLSVGMLSSCGSHAVIVGHSERRATGESNELIAQKAGAVIAARMMAIVCVGEKSRDTQGNYFGEVETQLRALFSVVSVSNAARLVIAYEPVWAIGTGKTPTNEEIHEMKLFIQKIISDVYGRSAVKKVRILYGGSVSEENAQQVLQHSEVDGFLVGGASLRPKEFGAIVKIAHTYARKKI